MTTEADKNASEEFDADDLFNSIVDKKDSLPEDSESETDSLLGPADEDSNEEPIEETPESDSEASDDEPVQDDDAEKEDAPEASTGDDAEPSDDIWAGANEKQREAYQNLHHERLQLQNDVRANAGRVQGYAKKLAEVQAQLDELRKQPSTSQQQTNAGEIQLEGKNLQEIEDEYPEIAQYVRHATQQVAQQFKQQLDPIQRQSQQFAGTVEEMASERQQVHMRNELDRLRDAHPDYVDLRSSPDFHNWLNSKPDSIRGLVNSMSADDNIELLNIYKSQKAPAAAPVETPVPPPQPAKKADLSEHAEIPRKGAAPPRGLPDDPEELFNLITSQKSY